MGLSMEEASTSTELVSIKYRNRDEPALDLIAAVKGLHELTPQQLSKLIREAGCKYVQHAAEDGSLLQIDMERFARYLPLHFMSVIMAWERDRSTFKYLLCGVLLVHAMCDLATRVPRIEQILLDDVKISEQLIDMVFYLLVVLAALRQENCDAPNDLVLLHSALVACSLKLLIVIVSPQFQEVAQVLAAHHKVDVFMDAAFSAVCLDVEVLQDKLSPGHAESSGSISPTNEETLLYLCQQCECSLQFLETLCRQKLFRECVVKNKELCGRGGVLVLVLAVLNLKLSLPYSESPPYMGSLSRLKCKALFILLQLCEAESVSYLDEVASSHRSQNLAKSVVVQVLELLKITFGIDSKKITASSESIHLKGQLELNLMRLADVFSDDSNFRSFFMKTFTEALTATFLLPHGVFLSGWCSSQIPVHEDNAELDVPWESYAHHVTSLLIKVIANLHCFLPDVCQDEKDLFLNKFVRFLQKEPETLSDGLPSFDTERTNTVSMNLRSLLSHAESLVPRFLNEEDVQLLRLFVNQFGNLIVPAASEDPLVKVAQNTGLHPLQGEVASNLGNGDIDVEMGTQENVSFQEVDQLDTSINGDDQSIDGERKCGMIEQDRPSGDTINLRENERDARAVQTSGSDSSPTQGKTDQMDVDQIKRSGFEETLGDEKVDTVHSDEKQQRKRKRTIMNDDQIQLVESALRVEPDMHRNSNSLQLWAEKLSLHGAEVTSSRLKNWLNNRKARLARVAKDVRVSYEEEKPDRQGGSEHSPTDDARVPSTARGSIRNEVMDTTSRASVDEGLGSSPATNMEVIRPGPYFPGQYVMLVGENAEEVGKGKVFQVHGKWCGRSLEQSGMCVVDIMELSVNRFAKLLHPTEVTGNSFDQAEKRLGLMRVLWDSNKLLLLPPR